MIKFEEVKYYKPKDIAKIFNITSAAVINWIKMGKLKCNKIGPKTFVITEQQLKDFLNAKSIP